MKNNFKLSIYIPTFNRVETLLELLNSLRALISEEQKTHIEIVVSDNASTDLTFDMMKQALDNGFIDHYIRRGKNLGSDVNILECFKATRGKFVWLLCDDDLPKIGSIENILNVIENYNEEISMIYLNRSIELMNGDLIKEAYTNCTNGIEYSKEKIIQSPGHDLLTASTLILNRKYENEVFTNALGIGYSIASLTLALNAVHTGPIYLFKEPQLRYREGDKSGWIAEWPKIWTENIPKAFKLFCVTNKIDESKIDPFIFKS